MKTLSITSENVFTIRKRNKPFPRKRKQYGEYIAGKNGEFSQKYETGLPGTIIKIDKVSEISWFDTEYILAKYWDRWDTYAQCKQE